MPERPPAPDPLVLVQDFVNSQEVEDEIEHLDSPEALADWLVTHGLAPEGTKVTARDLERVRAAREALRSVLLANNGEPLDPVAVDVLNAVAARVRLAPRFDVEGHVMVAGEGSGVDGALAQIVAVVLGAMADGTWSRLKVCRADTCGWAFYDHSRNRSGQWCVMAECGNRNKARTFRARQKARS
jgi:predicted RNA-binding Zn ribbon-like protein